METDKHGNRMDCAQFAVALLIAADEELARDELLRFEIHLADCAACRAKQGLFRLADGRLVECGELIDGLTAARSSKSTRPIRLEPRSWSMSLRRWRWAAITSVGVGVLAMAVWTTQTPPPADAGRSVTVDSPRPLGAGEPLDERADVIRVALPLSPIGNPFSDGSTSDLQILADVVIGSDGLPRTIRLAN
jgi:hypothetical protein